MKAYKGTGTYIGGTGKFTGIQGSGELTRINVCPVANGTLQGYNRVKINISFLNPIKVNLVKSNGRVSNGPAFFIAAFSP